MDDWVKVGSNEDFREGRGVAVDAGKQRVAVFRVGGVLHALQNWCPHMGASLADGKVEDGSRITCHMHGWTFDLTTGEPRGGRTNCARIYRIEARGDDVFVRLPDPPAPEADEDPWIPWTDDFLKKR